MFYMLINNGPWSLQ